jgi:hypothetical protein
LITALLRFAACSVSLLRTVVAFTLVYHTRPCRHVFAELHGWNGYRSHGNAPRSFGYTRGVMATRQAPCASRQLACPTLVLGCVEGPAPDARNCDGAAKEALPGGRPCSEQGTVQLSPALICGRVTSYVAVSRMHRLLRSSLRSSLTATATPSVSARTLFATLIALSKSTCSWPTSLLRNRLAIESPCCQTMS